MTGSAVGREERRVAVVTVGVVVDRVISLCLLRSLEEWLWGRVPSLSLSGVLRASMISSCAFDTECCVPCVGGRERGREGEREGGREGGRRREGADRREERDRIDGMFHTEASTAP